MATNQRSRGYIFHVIWDSLMCKMDDEKLGKLVKAMNDFAFRGIVYDGEDPEIRTAFELIAANIMQDYETYNDKCEKNRMNAQKRREMR